MGICPPMQGTRVGSLVQEAPARHGAPKPGAAVTEPARLEPGSTAGEATAVRTRSTVTRTGPARRHQRNPMSKQQGRPSRAQTATEIKKSN